MVFAFSPAVVATSTKLMPRGVPAIGDAGPGGGATGLASYERVIPDGGAQRLEKGSAVHGSRGLIQVYSRLGSGTTWPGGGGYARVARLATGPSEGNAKRRSNSWTSANWPAVTIRPRADRSIASQLERNTSSASKFGLVSFTAS